MPGATATDRCLGDGAAIGQPELTQVTPFKPTQIRLPLGCSVSVEQVGETPGVAGVPGLRGQAYVGCVDQLM